jgi:dephospho-CoA kinase
VCDILEKSGACIFDADEVGKQLLTDDVEARREMVREFGPESYHADGTLDRAYISSIVFADAERLAAINTIVHPRVFASFSWTRQQAESDGVALLVHEAALLFEAGGDRHVDATVYVDAPRWLRIRRVMERDGRSRASVVARIKHQIPAYRGREMADYVIRNDGTPEQLATRISQLLETLDRRFGTNTSHA